MRGVITLLFILSTVYFSYGQTKFYNEYLEEVEGVASVNELIRDFKQELHLDFYDIQGSAVVEVYIKSSNELLGIMMDKGEIKLSDLKFIKENPVLFSYMQKNSADIAVAIYHKEISKGMSTSHISSFLGDPVGSEMIYDKGQELTVNEYSNGSRVLFREGKVDNFIIPRS